MSEPWAHPERSDAPERTSMDAMRNDDDPATAALPRSEAPVQQTEQFMRGDYSSQPEYVQQAEHYQSTAGPQYAQQPENYHHGPTAQYDQPVYVQPAPVVRKKSGLVGVLGLLFVLVGIIGFGVALGMSIGNFELSEDFINDLAKTHTASSIVLLVAVGLWMLGSLLCLIGICARRGTIAGAIGLVLVLIPSWLLGLIIMAASLGSTIIVNSAFSG